MTLRWTQYALRDLESLHDFIERDKSDAAADMVEAIVTAIDLLPRNPHIGRPGRTPGTRELVVSPFVVAYRLHNGAIEVTAIIHSARRWPDSFD